MATIQTGDIYSFNRVFTQKQFTRFAALSGDDNPIHVDPDFSARTKFGRTVAHGMFLYANIRQALGEMLPGAIQLEQELMFPTPTYTGEPVDIRLAVTDFPADGLVRIETVIVKADGLIGCQGGALLKISGAKEETEHLTPAPQTADGTSWRGVAVGQSASLRRAYTTADLDEYLDLLGETNPAHTGTAAVASSLRGTSLPGPLFGALFSCLLGTELPGRGTNWLKQRFSFLAAAFPGDELSARVQVTRIRPEKDLVNLRTWVSGSGGDLLCDGEALVWVSDLESTG